MKPKTIHNLSHLLIFGALFFGVLFQPKRVCAQPPEEVNRLVYPFLEAYKQYDKEDIHLWFSKINENPEVLSYIRQNMPRVEQLYDMWILVRKADRLNAKYGNNYHVAPDERRRVTTSSQTGWRETSNGEITRNLRNQKATPNQFWVKRHSNQERVSNSQLSRNFKNSDRISNQARIRAALRRR